MQYEESQMPWWKAGEVAPPGIYLRVDDASYRVVILDREGPLPATFDGHVALYCPAAKNWAGMDCASPQRSLVASSPAP